MSVSIVIPSYNRPDRLALCLSALAKLDGGPYEIVVVDDGSAEPLAPVCAQYGANVRCIRQENAGPAKARNTGARAAGGDFIAFTDDDCQPAPGWIRALLAAHAGDPLRLVGGRVDNLLTGNVFAAASQSLCDYLYDYFGADAGAAPFFTSNNMGCARRRFEEIGGFDETFPLAAAEDREFGMRWRETGGQLVYAPEAVVGHAHHLTLGRFWRQHRNYGRGARHLHKVIDRRGTSRPRLESARFYLGLVSYPIRTRQRGGLSQAALLVLSQVAMTRGYFLPQGR
jgi:glycosyltransferase involved in cell wall biosynthesis